MNLGPTIEWAELTTIIFPISTVVVGAVLWIQKLIGDLKTDLSAFKQEVAKDYASNTMLEKFEARLLATVDKLGDRLDRRLAE